MFKQRVCGPWTDERDGTVWLVVRADVAVVICTWNEDLSPVTVRLDALVDAAARLDWPDHDVDELPLAVVEAVPYDGGLSAATSALGVLKMSPDEVVADGERIARDTSRSLPLTERHSTEYGDVYIRRMPTDYGQEVAVNLEGSDLELGLRIPFGEELPPPEWFYEERARLEAADAVVYLRDIPRALERGDLVIAFRAFRYHVRLARYGDPDVAAALAEHRVEPSLTVYSGLDLAEVLSKEGENDLAEWIARAVAEIAEAHCDSELAAIGWRQAALASEMLADADAVETSYQRAIVLAERDGNARVAAGCRMSAGVTAVMLLADIEAQRHRDDPSVVSQVARADAHLRAARAEYMTFDGESAAWARVAIALDLARIKDIRGDHAGALLDLADIERSAGSALDRQLTATLIHYRLAALVKRAAEDPADAKRQGIEGALQEAREVCRLGTVQIPGHRAAAMLTIIGDLLTSQGRFEEAVEVYLDLNILLLQGRMRLLRPAEPGSRPTGWLAIDAAWRFLNATFLARRAGGDAERFAFADPFLIADHVKGQHIKRDILFQLADDRIAPPMVRSQVRAVRDDLISGRLDRRLMLAERAYLRKMDGDSEAGRRLLPTEGPMTPAELEALGRSLPLNSKVLSIYSAFETTYMGIYDAESGRLDVGALGVSAQAVDRAVAYLQAYFSGTGLYGPIDPVDPDRHAAKMLRPLDEIASWVRQLAGLLAGADVVVLVPHRGWHNVPLHALLLPDLWQAGHDPAFTYVPSLALLAALRQRTQDGGAAAPEVALSTALTPSDPESEFREAHRELEFVLGASGRTCRAQFAATEADYLTRAAEAGLHHVLAHGRYRSGAHALLSGVAMSYAEPAGESILSAVDILDAGVSARHVTLQACSLGATVQAEGDELWGVTRALLATGADSVLAPLWNIDLGSSTALMTRFYRRWLVDGVSKHRAWADAQRAVAEASATPSWRHMYHWGAFQMIGL